MTDTKQVMYVGPTIPGLVEKNRIYLGELPEKIQKRVESDRSFARLFVPVDDLVAARQMLTDKTSVLSVSYRKVLKELNNE